MEEIKWLEADENKIGIKTIGFTDINEVLRVGRIVGYNGIVVGNKVLYKNKEYTVVMASRMGDLGLSETGELPYTIRALPKDIELI